MYLTREQAEKIREVIRHIANYMNDEDAINAPLLLNRWEPNVEYVTGDRLCYNNIAYKVLQSHTSQNTWTPDVSPSLFARILIPDPEVIPEWVQPDSTNPYMIGDKVTHNNIIWESIIDNNVWEPSVYGWVEVVE